MTHSNFFSLIHQSLQRGENKIFLHWNATNLTGKVISNRIALFRELLSKNVNSGESVLIARKLDTDTFLAVLAVMAHGAIPVLPPSRAQKMKLLRLFRKLRPKWIITNDNFGVIDKFILRILGIKVITLTAHETKVGVTVERPKEVPVHQPALITYSS